MVSLVITQLTRFVQYFCKVLFVYEVALMVRNNMVFTARRYASALYAVVVCLSVCLCVCVCVCHTPLLYQNG